MLRPLLWHYSSHCLNGERANVPMIRPQEPWPQGPSFSLATEMMIATRHWSQGCGELALYQSEMRWTCLIAI